MTQKITCFLTNVLDDLGNLLENFRSLARSSNDIDCYVFIVRTDTQKTYIEAFIKNQQNSLKGINYKTVVNPFSYLPLDKFKDLSTEFALIIPDTITVENSIIQKLIGSFSAPTVSFVYLNLTNNKIVSDHDLKEDHHIYSIVNDQPDVLDCYTIALVKKALLNYVNKNFNYTYFFKYLALLSKNNDFNYINLVNARIAAVSKESIDTQFTKVNRHDFNLANCLELTKEPKLSALEKLFSIKYKNSRYYLSILGLQVHFKVKRKISFPKNACECSYVKADVADKRLNRICIFAGFTANGNITENNLYYLSCLSQVVDYLVYVADSKANPDTIEKLIQYCDAIFIRRHGEYDFGSYKLGYNFLKDRGILDKSKQLLLCNDSIDFVGQPNDLQEIVNSSVKYDAYSLCTATYGFGKKIKSHKYEWVKNPHLQSYFLMLDNSVFNSSYFKEFINSVSKQENKTKIIKLYEIGLSEMLKQHNVNMGSFYPYDDSCIVNPYLLYLTPNNKESIFIKHTLLKTKN